MYFGRYLLIKLLLLIIPRHEFKSADYLKAIS